jgi:hypothetical protein
MEKDFEVGKHLEGFDSISEMLIKCEDWLKRDEERKTIARQGCELATKEFSYYNIVKQILEL